MRTILIALLMSLATQVGADTTDKKLDLILEKLENIEATYQKLLETSEAFSNLFSPDLFGTESGIEQETELNEALEEAIESALTGASTGSKDDLTQLSGNNFLEIVDWSASEKKSTYDTYIKLQMSFRNISSRAISLIDGSVVMEDKLGQKIIRVSLENDLNLNSNEVFSQEGFYDPSMQWGGGNMKRLLTINKSLVVVNFDVDQILFEDGTKLSFE